NLAEGRVDRNETTAGVADLYRREGLLRAELRPAYVLPSTAAVRRSPAPGPQPSAPADSTPSVVDALVYRTDTPRGLLVVTTIRSGAGDSTLILVAQLTGNAQPQRGFQLSMSIANSLQARSNAQEGGQGAKELAIKPPIPQGARPATAVQ